MGKNSFERARIPATGRRGFLILALHGYKVSAVIQEFPHAVIFVDSLDDPGLMSLAPKIRYDRSFQMGRM